MSEDRRKLEQTIEGKAARNGRWKRNLKRARAHKADYQREMDDATKQEVTRVLS